MDKEYKRYKKVFDQVAGLEYWLKKEKPANGWSITEKLAFLRNVEANCRTEEAKFRTWLAVAGCILAVTAFILALLN